MNIGAKVTLRGDRMYVFVDKLFNIVLPRIRDFRGLPTQVVRRARKLQSGTERAARLPGDQLRQGGQDTRHGRHHRDDGQDRRGSVGVPRRDGSAVAERPRLMAKTSLIVKSQAQAEVQRAPPQPVQGVRSPARVSAQVRHVPHLLPRERAHGRRPGRDQGVVVRGTTICP